MSGRVLLCGALLLAGCSGPDKGNSTTTAVQAQRPDVITRQPGGWQTSTEIDAMNDQTVYRARGTVSNSVIIAQTEVICTNSRAVYVLTLFNAANQPAEMQISYGHIPAALRIDDQPPINISRGAQVPNRLDFFELEPKLVTASKLTVRLYLVDGEQTLVINQTDAKLRRLLDQCAAALAQQRAAEKADRDQRAAELQARCGNHACPIPGEAAIDSMEAPVDNRTEH